MPRADEFPALIVPVDRQDPFHPPREYRQLRAECPVAKARLTAHGPVAWLVTRHVDAMTVLSDTRFSSDDTAFNDNAAAGQRTASAGKSAADTLIRMDPPEHSEYRRMLSPLFAGRRIRELTPVVRLTGQLLGTVTGSHLLGLPPADGPYLQARADFSVQRASTPEMRDQATDDLIRYMAEAVRAKLARPRGDVLSQLAVEHVRTGHLSPAAAADLARLVFVAGTVSTVNTIGLAILTLLRHPEQLSELQADPGLARSAANELLRHLSTVRTLLQGATRDTEVGGVLIRAGERVAVSLSSANRDERCFRDPDRFDIHRSGGAHLAFGHGAHLCLGAALARMEIQVAVTSVFRHLPGLRLAAPLEEITFRDRMTLYGLNSLPVTWDRS
jgi:cytochrome P450